MTFHTPKPWNALPKAKGILEFEVVLRHGDASCNAWIEVEDMGKEGYAPRCIRIPDEDGKPRSFDKYDPAFVILAAAIDRWDLEQDIAEHGEDG